MLARTGLPYLRDIPRLNLGRGMAIHNPLILPERVINRAYQIAVSQSAHQRQWDEWKVLEELQEILVREKIVMAYQPILNMEDRTVIAYEALTRIDNVGTIDSPSDLFAAASEHHLLIELDRLCRAHALLSSSRIPNQARLFINTLPATIRDPEFRGRSLIELLDRAKVSPNRIVFEITEKLVIENYGLFQDAMSYFTDLGMSLAVDDVGAGYSGLEAIARLAPSFLKIDLALIRNIHLSGVNQEMVKAILSLGKGIGATVIAEGIQTDDEIRALQSIGVRYGQGFALGRPIPSSR